MHPLLLLLLLLLLIKKLNSTSTTALASAYSEVRPCEYWRHLISRRQNQPWPVKTHEGGWRRGVRRLQGPAGGYSMEEGGRAVLLLSRDLGPFLLPLLAPPNTCRLWFYVEPHKICHINQSHEVSWSVCKQGMSCLGLESTALL